MHHHDADDSAEEDVAAKDAGCGDGDQYGQQGKRGVGCHIQEEIPAGTGEAGDGLAEGFDETHHQAGGHDGGEDGNEDVAGGLEDFLPPGHLGGGGLLDLRLGGGGEPGDGQELVIHLVDGSGADDQLELTVGFEHALDAFHVLQSLGIHLAVVGDDQTEAGGTMGCADDVLFAAEIGKDLFRAFAVVECHFRTLLFVLYSQPKLKTTW